MLRAYSATSSAFGAAKADCARQRRGLRRGVRAFLPVAPFADAGGAVALEVAAPPSCVEGHAPSVAVRVSSGVRAGLSPVVYAASLLALVSAVEKLFLLEMIAFFAAPRVRRFASRARFRRDAALG